MNEQNTNQENELTDLEPNCEVKGGGTGIFGEHNTGALRNVSGSNTPLGGIAVNNGASLQITDLTSVAIDPR